MSRLTQLSVMDRLTAILDAFHIGKASILLIE